VIKIGRNQRGKRDGTGPYKDSYQRRTSNTGKRIQAGKKCPVKNKKN